MNWLIKQIRACKRLLEAPLPSAGERHARFHQLHIELLRHDRRQAPESEWLPILEELLDLNATARLDEGHTTFAFDALTRYFAYWPTSTQFKEAGRAVFTNAAKCSTLDDAGRAMAVVHHVALLFRTPQIEAGELRALGHSLERWAKRTDLALEVFVAVTFARAQIAAATGLDPASDAQVIDLTDMILRLLPASHPNYFHVATWQLSFRCGVRNPPAMTWHPERDLRDRKPTDIRSLPLHLVQAAINEDPQDASTIRVIDRLFDYIGDLDRDALDPGALVSISAALSAYWSLTESHGYKARMLTDHLVAVRYGSMEEPEGWSPDEEDVFPPFPVDEAAHVQPLFLRDDDIPPAVLLAWAHQSLAGVFAQRVTPVEGATVSHRLCSAIERAVPDSQVRVYAAEVAIVALDRAMRGAAISFQPEYVQRFLTAIDESAGSPHPKRATLASGLITLLMDTQRFAECAPYAEEIIASPFASKEEVAEARCTAAIGYVSRSQRQPAETERQCDLRRAEQHARAGLSTDDEESRLRALAHLAHVLREQSTAGFELPPGLISDIQRDVLSALPPTGNENRRHLLNAVIDMLRWDDAGDDRNHGELLLQAFVDMIGEERTTVHRVVEAARAVVLGSPDWVPPDIKIYAGQLYKNRLAVWSQFHQPMNIIGLSEGILTSAAYLAVSEGRIRDALELVESGLHLLAHHECGHGPDEFELSHNHHLELTTTEAPVVRALAGRNSAPIVHLAVGEEGSFALLSIPGSRHTEALLIPDLDSTTVTSWKDYLSIDAGPSQPVAQRATADASASPTRTQVRSMLDHLRSVLDPLVAALPQAADESPFFDLVTIGPFIGLPWLAAGIQAQHRWLPRVHSSAQFIRSALDKRATGSDSGLAVVAPDPTIRHGVLQPVLDHALAEGRHLSERYGAALLAGPNATKHAFLEAVERPHRFIHLGMHGEVDRGDLDEPILLFASDTGSGAAKSEDTEAAALHASTVKKDTVQADLVFLASCWTGSSARCLPSEAIGFSTSLQRAGARAVIAPLWPVDDDVTEQLVRLFYANWLERGVRADVALANAARALRRLYPASATWAAFNFSGVPTPR